VLRTGFYQLSPYIERQQIFLQISLFATIYKACALAAIPKRAVSVWRTTTECFKVHWSLCSQMFWTWEADRPCASSVELATA
jgi:hypothetical protein